MVATAFMDVRLHRTPQKCSHRCEEVFSGLITCLLLLGLPCPAIRPEILKHEMKVFFVKYNDPIYVKLEKLDIMIRLASQANIAQVSSGWWLGRGVGVVSGQAGWSHCLQFSREKCLAQGMGFCKQA